MTASVTFVIPCYRSENMIGEVVSRLRSTVEKRYSVNDYEIVLVDDCSPDGTFSVIAGLSKKYGNVKAVGFSKNFGQQSALMAGFSVSKGDVIVCLDDDGQTPPEGVFKLIDKLNEGFDIVYASYDNKQHSFFRNFGSWVNEKMAESLIGKPKNVTLSSFYAVRRFLVDEALRYSNPFPYVTGQFLRATSKVANVPIVHCKRMEGESGYTVKKLFSLWLNGFTAFSVKPLRLASFIGVLCSVFGLLFAIFVIARKLVDPDVAMGWTSTFALILVVGGIILFVLGLVGEYVGRIYICLNNLPQYVVRRSVGCDSEEAE